jgi:hypothetical protein
MRRELVNERRPASRRSQRDRACARSVAVPRVAFGRGLPQTQGAKRPGHPRLNVGSTREPRCDDPTWRPSRRTRHRLGATGGDAPERRRERSHGRSLPNPRGARRRAVAQTGPGLPLVIGNPLRRAPVGGAARGTIGSGGRPPVTDERRLVTAKSLLVGWRCARDFVLLTVGTGEENGMRRLAVALSLVGVLSCAHKPGVHGPAGARLLPGSGEPPSWASSSSQPSTRRAEALWTSQDVADRAR